MNAVDPVYEPQRHFIGKNVSERILKYWKSNEIEKFTYSRPLAHTDQITVSLSMLAAACAFLSTEYICTQASVICQAMNKRFPLTLSQYVLCEYQNGSESSVI